MSTASRSATIGVAIGDGVLTAAVVAGGETRFHTSPLGALDAVSAAASLAAGFEQLAGLVTRQLGSMPRRPRVHVALLPPHIDVRLVPLPPLQEAEAEAVLRRDAARHFLGAGQPRTVGVRMPPRAPEAAGRPVLAAAAAMSLLESVRAAAAAVGWTVDAVGTAHGAWLAAAESGDATSIAVVAQLDGTAHVLRSEGGAVTVLRRLSVGSPEEIAGALGHGPGTARLFADGTVRALVTPSLQQAGWNVAAGGVDDPAAAAALHAAGALPRLAPPSALRDRARRAHRLATRFVAAAVVLLIAAAAVDVWGAQRQLDAVRERRAAIRADVAPLLQQRDSLAALEERIANVRRLTDGAPRWTRALFDIALLLPPEAHLTRFVATDETVEIEAAGTGAGTALNALRSAGTLRDVRLLGTVDRELADGITALERFRFGARYVAPAESFDLSAAAARPPRAQRPNAEEGTSAAERPTPAAPLRRRGEL